MSISRSLYFLARFIAVFAVVAMLVVPACAKEDAFRQEYSAFGVTPTAGGTVSLEIVITRWTTDEERVLLANNLKKKGQDATIKLLREQKETGWIRRTDGEDIQGLPTVRLHYAREFQLEDGRRLLILLTERPVGSFQSMATSDREANLAGVRMDLKEEDGLEQGKGVVFRAIKIAFDEDNKIKLEGQALEPVRLTRIIRKK